MKKSTYWLTNQFHQQLRSGAALVSVLFLLSACGPQVTLMSEAQEAKIGAQQHDKIVESSGGVYDNPKLNAYVQNIMRRVAAASDRPDIPFQITILDTPMINAFALPGGYTYVTRGLLGLANSEAEVASVIGHEIGHVTARHSAQRQTAAVGTGLAASVLGAVIGQKIGGSQKLVGNLLNVGGKAVLAGYSRGQEYEADDIGVKTSAMAGYKPAAAADFLASLSRESRFQANLKDRDRPAGSDWFATHPNTEERVARARGLAANFAGLSKTVKQGRATHFAAIDQITYGDSADNGFVRGQSFTHPKLKVKFTVPKGYELTNGARAVVAQASNGSKISFDMAKMKTASPREFVQTAWLKNDPAASYKDATVAGRPASIATVQKNGAYYYFAAIQKAASAKAAKSDLSAYRFMMQSRGDGSKAFMSVLNSFKFLTNAQANKTKPSRIKIVTVQKKDSLKSLANLMAVSGQKVERFRILNALPVGVPLKPGQRVKLIR
ncbi:M48 family metalloprotease [Alphaproteobacteria bacterium]|nr:M48 family metalloprotease [Alphaproteobacteria bacterium]